MSSADGGDNVALSRIPLLLSVVEGMLEVGTSQLSELQMNVKKGTALLEKTQRFAESLVEQRDFMKVISLDCRVWRGMSLSVSQLRQIEKLESCLKDLAGVHVQLLEHLFPC